MNLKAISKPIDDLGALRFSVHFSKDKLPIYFPSERSTPYLRVLVDRLIILWKDKKDFSLYICNHSVYSGENIIYYLELPNFKWYELTITPTDFQELSNIAYSH